MKEEISNLYGIRKPKKFISFMETIVLMRNTCVHSVVLSSSNTPEGILSIPEVSFERSNHSLLAYIKAIAYILRRISSSREEDILDSIRSTLHKHNGNQMTNSVVENKMKVFSL